MGGVSDRRPAPTEGDDADRSGVPGNDAGHATDAKGSP